MYYKTFEKKNIYFFKKKDFLVFFFSFPCFEWKWRKKQEIYLFSRQFIFFSQNCINYLVSIVSWRISILSKKDHLNFSSKKGIYAISRLKFLFTEKVNFLMIFCLFHCFYQTINIKHWILPQYTFFSEKKTINDVFLNFLGVLTSC